jgi:hypothetical protein
MMNMITSRQALFWFAVAAPVLTHFTLLLLYSVNAPRLDDFSDGLTLLPQFYSTDSSWEKFKIIFSQYQNHRWAFLHSIYFIYECIDFRSANFISLIPLIALPWIWFRLFRTEKYAKTLLIISATIVFNLHSWTGTFWITASLAAIPVVPLALMAFILITRNNWGSFWLAAITAIIATFTNGNGVTIWPIASLYLLYIAATAKENKYYAMLSVWIVFSAILLFVYFSKSILDHQIPGSNNIHGAFEKILSNPFLFIQGIFATVGSISMYHTSGLYYKLPLAISIGIVEIGALIWLFSQGALRKYPAIILLAVFILGTTTAITATRVVFLGIEQAFQGHYKLYNGVFLLILITAYLDYLSKNTHSKTHTYAVLASAYGLYLLSFVLFFPDIRQYHHELSTDTRNWLHTHTLQRAESRYLVKKPNQKLETAFRGHFYDPWTLMQESQKPDNTIFLANCNPGGDALEAISESQKFAAAVKIQLSLKEKAMELIICSPLQAIKISLSDIHFTREENGTYDLELWVPRNTSIREDEGPWQVYLPK